MKKGNEVHEDNARLRKEWLRSHVVTLCELVDLRFDAWDWIFRERVAREFGDRQNRSSKGVAASANKLKYSSKHWTEESYQTHSNKEKGER